MSKKKFCFVSTTGQLDNPLNDGSTRYRCFHIAESLQRMGHKVAVYSNKQFLTHFTNAFDVYIFHRPSAAILEYETIFSILKDKVLIADYDDLIVGGENEAKLSSIYKNKLRSLESTIKVYEDNLRALSYFPIVTVSTEYLKSQIENFSKAKIYVLNNSLPNSIFELTSSSQNIPIQHRPFSIGYFPGTKSHDIDITVISHILHRYLYEHEQNWLLVLGQVYLPPYLLKHDNIKLVKVQNYFRYLHYTGFCQKIVAPLENSIFNSCKSNVKFLESSLFNTRVYTSPNSDFTKIPSKYISICKNEDEWYYGLEEQVDANINYRAYVMDNFSSDKTANQLLEIIK